MTLTSRTRAARPMLCAFIPLMSRTLASEEVRFLVENKYGDCRRCDVFAGAVADRRQHVLALIAGTECAVRRLLI